jgi:putative flippase GtrA
MIAEMLRFLVTGAFNTAVTYIIFLIGAVFVPISWAYTFAYVLGILLSYLLNAVFVFRNRISKKTAKAYPLIYLFQYLLGLILLELIVNRANIEKEYGVLIVIAINIPVSFALARMVFKAPINKT